MTAIDADSSNEDIILDRRPRARDIVHTDTAPQVGAMEQAFIDVMGDGADKGDYMEGSLMALARERDAAYAALREGYDELCNDHNRTLRQRDALLAALEGLRNKNGHTVCGCRTSLQQQECYADRCRRADAAIAAAREVPQ